MVYNRLDVTSSRSVKSLATNNNWTAWSSDRFKDGSKYLVGSYSPQTLDGRCATHKYFQILSSIHDIQSYLGLLDTSSLNVHIFTCHWGQCATIFLWVSRIHFHIGSHGNYHLWELNPINSIPIAHAVFDPHFALSKISKNISHNGIYNNLLCVGFNRAFDLYKIVITDELLGLISIGLALIHFISVDGLMSGTVTDLLINTGMCEYKQIASLIDHAGTIAYQYASSYIFKLFAVYFDLGKQGLNFHSGIIIGLISMGWTAHLVHLAIPISRGCIFNKLINPQDLPPTKCRLFYTSNWVYDIAPMDKDPNIFSHSAHSGSSTITFFGGLKSNTISLYLTDIAHHHICLGILFVLSSHVYSLVYKAVGHFSTNDVGIGNPVAPLLIV